MMVIYIYIYCRVYVEIQNLITCLFFLTVVGGHDIVLIADSARSK